MSLNGAMYSGVMGLNNNSAMMEIIGNNLANINTTGFKFARADFADLLSKQLTGGVSIGRGSRLGNTSTIFAQGSIAATENVTDLALQGNGFFMVTDGTTGREYFTRSGGFEIDSEGFLVNSQGFRLQGYSLDADRTATGTTHDLQIPQPPLEPQMTSTVQLLANLDSRAEGVGPFDLTDPVNTSNYSTSISVYDSLGNAHQVTVYFTNDPGAGSVGGNLWTYNVVVDAADSATGVDTIATTGTLDFTTDGALQAWTETLAPSFNFSGNPTQNQIITFNFGTSIADGGTGLDGTTQFGSDSALVYATQDGFGSSYIDNIQIDEDGVITAYYGNGEYEDLGQIAVANFANIQGLASEGDNLYTPTFESGVAIISTANVSGNGTIFSNALESSNADIADQFVQMITAQRSYQANSRSISTADQMVADLINIVG